MPFRVRFVPYYRGFVIVIDSSISNSLLKSTPAIVDSNLISSSDSRISFSIRIIIYRIRVEKQGYPHLTFSPAKHTHEIATGKKVAISHQHLL